MTPQLISTIISLLAVVIIVFQVIWCAGRGLKKSVFRLIWVLAFGILCLLLSSVIANALVNMDISFLGINVDGQDVSTLPAYIAKMLESSNPNMADIITDNPQIMALCTQIASMLLSLVVFELLFWLTKWLLWPLWAILSAVFIKRKTKVVTEQKKLSNGTIIPSNTQVIKAKKHAGYGALVGVALGLICSIFTFIPIIGINNALVQIDTKTKVEQGDGTSVGLVTQYLGESADYLNVYNDSIICQVFTYTGVDALGGAISSGLTTTTYNGEQISLTKEIDEFAPLYVDYQNYQKIDMTNLTKESLSNLLTIASDVSNRALSSDIVGSLYNQLAPYLVDKILNQADYFIQLPDLGNDTLNDVLKTALDSIKDVKIDDLKNDVLTIIDMAKSINDKDLLVGLVNGTITLSDAQSKLDNTLGQKLNNDLFSMKTINVLLPNIVQSGVKYLCEKLNITFVKTQNLTTATNLKTLFSKFFTDAIDIVNGIDTSTPLYISADSFDSVGDIADSIKSSGAISLTTWNNLMDYAVDYIKDNFTNTIEDTNLRSAAGKFVESIKTIENYKTECTYFGDAYKEYQTYMSTDGAKLDIAECAKIIDKITSSQIYNYNIKLKNTNSDSIFASLIAYVKGMDLPFDTSNIDDVVLSIQKLDGENAFETEYSYISSLIDFVTSTSDFTADGKLKELGEKLDKAIKDGSILASNDNCRILLTGFVKKFELPDDIKTIKIGESTIKDVLIENIKTLQGENVYRDELSNVEKLLKIDSTITLQSIGTTLDNLAFSKLMKNGILNALLKYGFEQGTKDLDAVYSTVVDTMTSNIDNITDVVIVASKNASGESTIYSTEMGYIQGFIDSIPSDRDMTATDLSNYLATKLLDAEHNNPSIIMANNVLYDVLSIAVQKASFTWLDETTEVVPLKNYIQQVVDADESSNKQVYSIVEQMVDLTTSYADAPTIPTVDTSITRDSIIEIGSFIDALNDYNLLFNDGAMNVIGKHCVDQFNSKVQNSELPQQQKDDVQAEVNKIQYVDASNNPLKIVYATLFGTFATEIGLTAE